MKIYKCGMCTRNKFSGTRKGLRKHLRTYHHIRKELTNGGGVADGKKKDTRQSWWIVEEWKASGKK